MWEFVFINKETGKPYDLSGWILYFTARRRKDDALIIDKQMAVIDPQNGRAQLALSEKETNFVGIHKAEIQAKSNTGVETVTLAQGDLVIHNTVRR